MELGEELPQAGALAMNKQWDELVRLVRGPEGQARAMESTRIGWLALHWAAKLHAPPEVVRALLDAYPQGVQMATSDGQLPLHLAAFFQAPVEVVRALLDAYPQGVQTTNDAGLLPLHMAAATRAPPEVVHALLDAYPQGAQRTNSEGVLPLHMAAATQAPPEVVRALLDAYPQGAQTMTSNRSLALHCAAACQASLEVVRALLDAYPQGAQMVNNNGRLPLHLAGEAGDDVCCPKVHMMLALAYAGYPPSRPWTPETCAALCATLRGIDLNPMPAARRALVRALIGAHVSRVRTLLLAFRRLGLPSALTPLLIGAVYTTDLLR